MRKHRVWVRGRAPAAPPGSVGPAGAFPTTQLINGKVTPTNRPKAKRVPATLFVDVSATTDNPNGIPSPAKLGKVDFDKDGVFYQTGLATCDPSQFNSATTTQQATSTCGASQIRTG